MHCFEKDSAPIKAVSLKNDNFWKSSIWDTIQEKFYFIEKLFSVVEILYANFCILNQSINFRSWDVKMSMRTWGRVHFWIYLLNYTSFVHETLLANRHNHANTLR